MGENTKRPVKVGSLLAKSPQLAQAFVHTAGERIKEVKGDTTSPHNYVKMEGQIDVNGGNVCFIK